MDTASASLENKPLKETEEPLDDAFPGPGCDPLATDIQIKQQTHVSWCHAVLGKSQIDRSLTDFWQKYIFWMTIHVFLKHHLLYEFILLLHKWLQSFSHLSFEPAQKWNRIFSVHIFPKNYSHCCWFQGSSVLPFTFVLCEDEFVSKFGFSLILPPEFVSILPVFWADIQQSLNVKIKDFFHVIKNNLGKNFENIWPKSVNLRNTYPNIWEVYGIKPILPFLA